MSSTPKASIFQTPVENPDPGGELLAIMFAGLKLIVPLLQGDYGSSRIKATADPSTIENNLKSTLEEMKKYLDQLPPNKKATLMDQVEKLKVIPHS